MKCTFQEAKSPVKNLFRHCCAEGFNSGIKGLSYPIEIKILLKLLDRFISMNEVPSVMESFLQIPPLLHVKCLMYKLVPVLLLNLTVEVYFSVLICLYKSRRQCICHMNEA
jgi:hypothetical protein